MFSSPVQHKMLKKSVSPKFFLKIQTEKKSLINCEKKLQNKNKIAPETSFSSSSFFMYALCAFRLIFPPIYYYYYYNEKKKNKKNSCKRFTQIKYIQ